MESCFTIEKWITLNSQSSGKEKVARLLQYLSRFIYYYIEKRRNLKVVVSQLKILEKALSSFRKLLRFGKSFEVIYGALKTIHLKDQFLRIVLTLSRIYQSLFLFCDHCVWLTDGGFLNVDKKNLNRSLNKFWLGSIVLGILRDAYEIKSVISIKSYGTQKYTKPIKPKSYSSKIASFVNEHEDIFWDTVKNICDIWIPLTNLGHLNLSPGLIGMLGVISSFAGIVPLVKPVAKLAPN